MDSSKPFTREPRMILIEAISLKRKRLSEISGVATAQPEVPPARPLQQPLRPEDEL